MNDHSSSVEFDWHKRCYDALDFMRDRADDGRDVAAEILLQAEEKDDQVMRLSAELLYAFANFFDKKIDLAEPEFARLAQQFEILHDHDCMMMSLFGSVAVLYRRGLTREAYDICH